MTIPHWLKSALRFSHCVWFYGAWHGFETLATFIKTHHLISWSSWRHSKPTAYVPNAKSFALREADTAMCAIDASTDSITIALGSIIAWARSKLSLTLLSDRNYLWFYIFILVQFSFLTCVLWSCYLCKIRIWEIDNCARCWLTDLRRSIFKTK